MSRCQHLIDISPYDPLCDHPCRLYGGGAFEAECETCQYRIADLEAENAKLRELCSDMWIYITEPVSKRHNLKERFARFDDIGDRMRELGVEVV